MSAARTISSELARFSPSVINASDYGRMIFDLAQRRELIRVGEEIVNVAYDPPVDLSPGEQIEEAEKQLYAISEKGRFGGGFKSFRQALTGAVEVAERAHKSPSHITGVATGFTDLDNLLGGFQPSDLIVIAGAPRHGQDGARHQHRLSRRARMDAHRRQVGRTRRLLLARNVGRTIGDAYLGRASRKSPAAESAAARSTNAI